MIARMIPRRLASELATALAESPAVALLGPRQVGKTTLGDCNSTRTTMQWFGSVCAAETYNHHMSSTVAEVLKQALALDEEDRASVAGALIESLQTDVDPGAEEAWDEEIRRRLEKLDRGAAKLTPWSEVRERLFRGFE